MENNIYSAPQAELIEESDNNKVLASRWKRLWASMLDSITILVVTLPTMYLTGGFEGAMKGIQPSVEYSLMIGAVGISFFLIINIKLLMNNGQTIGKKILGIKIVDLEGNLPTFKKQLIKRYAVFFLPGQIPVAGQFISILNVLFIFGKQKRCVHDFAAGTKVIVA